MIRKLLATSLALALTAALAQPVADGAIGDGEYANTLAHAESGATLYWTVDGENLHLAFTMTASGWAGLGWLKEQSNRKAGGDILIVTIEGGAPVLHDMFQESARGEPVHDEDEGGANSYTAFAATHEGGVWTVEVTRPLATGQTTDVDIVPGESMMFMVAYAGVMDITRQHPRDGRWYIEDFAF